MPDAVEALKACDMLIDCVFLLFSPEQFAIQAAGTRILTAVEPPELLARLLPTKELREKVEMGGELLAKAKVMRITSPHGTDVTYKLNTYPTVTEYACTDEPGRWDHWPSGFVFTGGDDDGVDGQIVVAPGDILLPQNMYVREPITYTIEKGWVTDIRGGLEAELVKSYMDAFGDKRGFGMSHVGWGMNPRRAGTISFPANSPAVWAWSRAAIMAMSCSQPGRTTSWAGPTIPPATSTFRCAAVRYSWTMSRGHRRRYRRERAADGPPLRQRGGRSWPPDTQGASHVASPDLCRRRLWPARAARTRPAIVVVDFTYGFTDTQYPTAADMRSAIAATRQLTDFARAAGVPVIYTTIAYHLGEIGKLPWLKKASGMAALLEGTRLVEIDASTGIQPQDAIVVKRAHRRSLAPRSPPFWQAPARIPW